MELTKLILIRHGQTSWTAEKRYCGSVDIGLSMKGREQARRLKAKLNNTDIDRVYSSNKKRALQTAKIVFGTRKIHEVAGLKEMHFGVFEGLTYKEIMKRYPEIYQKWISAPFSVVIPEGETLINFQKRVVRAIKKIIILNKNKTVAVVCHGGPISAFITAVFKSKDFWKWIPRPCGFRVIEYKRGRGVSICQK